VLALVCAAGSAMAQIQGVAHDLVLWLKADEGVLVDGSGISSWLDSSPAGHDATQGSAAERPTLIPAVINGRPVARFDGNDWLAIAGQVLTSDQFTIVAVVNDTRIDGGFKEVFSNWAFSNTLSSVFFGTTALDPVGPDSTRARLTDDVGGANEGQGGVGAISNRSNHFIFTGVSGAASARVLQNRVLVAERATAISPRNFTTPYVVGRQGQLGGEYWQGDIAELLVFNAELSECELSLVYDELHAKYGLAPRVCPADFDCSGGVDSDDVILFFTLWDINDLAADFNGDDGVDADDVIAFFTRWDAGC
jgi:hypothetical protein